MLSLRPILPAGDAEGLEDDEVLSLEEGGLTDDIPLTLDFLPMGVIDVGESFAVAVDTVDMSCLDLLVVDPLESGKEVTVVEEKDEDGVEPFTVSLESEDLSDMSKNEKSSSSKISVELLLELTIFSSVSFKGEVTEVETVVLGSL